MRFSSANPRHALTLLEVIVSMAIFLMSLVAIYQLVLLGSERAMDVRLQARTSLCCQAKLDELMIGAESLNSTGYSNFKDKINQDLQWKVEASPHDVTGLWNVKVWVKMDLHASKVIESQLSRIMLDPSIRGSTLDQPNPSAPSNPTQDTTTPPTNPPSTSGTSNPTAPASTSNSGKGSISTQPAKSGKSGG